MPLLKDQLRRNGFTFKQFFVAHDRCAMKVGIDGILLGAWAPVTQHGRVLDIGTGSALIALMMAQRTPGNVALDAVEMDAQAAAQAAENVMHSPWARRIRVHQQDILHFDAGDERYCRIVSNPPYFSSGISCSSAQRTVARHTDTLSHQALLACAERHITRDGLFSLILPQESGNRFIDMAQHRGWYLRFRNDIADSDARLPHRVMFTLSLQYGEPHIEKMVIRTADRGWSADFRCLTSDFYLFMSSDTDPEPCRA